MPKSPIVADVAPLLVIRKQAEKLLSCSHSQLVELERMGRLTPVKLTQSPASVVHYRLSQIRELAGE